MLGLGLVLDRVRERGPGRPQCDQEQEQRRRDTHADGVEADLGGALHTQEQEPVGEVDRPEREPGRHEREAEALHLAEERPVELEPELEAPVREQREVDGERAGEVADDHADRALVQDGDELDRCTDRDDDVHERGGHVGDRPLLDPEERGQLLVVHLRPDEHEGRADEVRLRRSREEPVGDLRGEQRAEHQRERRHAHREPERGAHDPDATGIVLRVEVEAEERHRDAHAEDDHEHDRERDQRVHAPELRAREVASDDRQQEEPDQPRDDRTQPVDGRVLPQAPQLLP